jgi:hypothetical protein
MADAMPTKANSADAVAQTFLAGMLLLLLVSGLEACGAALLLSPLLVALGYDGLFIDDRLLQAYWCVLRLLLSRVQQSTVNTPRVFIIHEV